ncbi:monovalent cation/H(+) antiporter subunit G [Ningiella sp. W23]|uniref:monovalent cation/H(+) antiporter subunit G n=1 Tax=Ningiella sp. W23 TaxID=3023715 RepID=UPI00375830C2
MVIDFISVVFISVGLVFFIAGTVGLIRFPDVYSRLHALTKADNLGLGFIVFGVIIQMNNVPDMAKAIVVWILVLLASATSCHLIARRQYSKKRSPNQDDADSTSRKR